MNEKLILMIRERENELAQIQEELTPLFERARGLEVEINVLKEAQNKIGVEAGNKTKRKRERALQPHWNKTLLFIGRMGEAHLNDINRFITQELGMEMSPETQRSQLANYTNRGWLARVAEGVFKLTESGAQKCGYSEKNEAPEGASMVGEAATSPVSNATGFIQTQKISVDDLM